MGKLVTVDLPLFDEMELFNQWHDKKEDINRRLEMLNEQIKTAETEEIRNEYRNKGMKLITENRMPRITPKFTIRARTIQSGKGLVNLEPAFPKDIKTLRKYGYNF